MDAKISKVRWLIGTSMLVGVLSFGIWGVGIHSANATFFEDEEYEKNEHEDHERIYSRYVVDKVYISECGECHIAYPPGLLPAQSWREIMSGLEDHFGDNAELDKESAVHIKSFLEQQALNRLTPSRLNKMSRNIPAKAPLRITELPYFIHEHDEMTKPMVIDNPKVISFSHCDRCHKDAVKGEFDEDNVYIPGFGRWDD